LSEDIYCGYLNVYRYLSIKGWVRQSVTSQLKFHAEKFAVSLKTIKNVTILKLNYPIPDMLEKYGGLQKFKQSISELTVRQLLVPSIRRCFAGLSSEQIIEYNCALIAFVLGHPLVNYDFSLVRDTLVENRVTLDTYEEIIRLLRQVLLETGVVSRDISIAINVLDMHSEAIVGVKILRSVKSPFSGVDRRRRDRTPTAKMEIAVLNRDTNSDSKV
jgi:hypothetical protein